MSTGTFQLVVGEIDFTPTGDPHPDAPMPLHLAVCLPDLGGSLFQPSMTWSVKMLRGAISRGELVAERT